MDIFKADINYRKIILKMSVKAMDKKSDNINIKSLAIAFIVSGIILNYVFSNGGSFMNFQAVIIVGVIAFIFFILCFLIIRMIAYYVVEEKIYPNIIFRILLPFFSILFVSFIVYGFIFIKPFGAMEDFIGEVKTFVTKIIPFIAVSTIITGFILSMPFKKNEIRNKKLVRSNLLFLLVMIGLSIISVYLFYFMNRIEQEKRDKNHSYYKNLNEIITSENYEMELLLDSKNNYVSKPYFLVNKNELIINVLSDNMNNGNQPPALLQCYKIDKEGKIISELSSSELESATAFPIVFEEGYLRNYDSTMVSTWAFNGNREKLKYKELKKNKDWKIQKLSEENENIKMVRFFGTTKWHCDNNKSIHFNGTKYYNLTKEKDILKIKIDSVYSHIDNCEEKKITYYGCKNLNFSLLCYNEKTYYIIKPRKK